MGLFDNVFEKEVKYIKNLELIKKFRNSEIYIRFFERVYSPKSIKNGLSSIFICIIFILSFLYFLNIISVNPKPKTNLYETIGIVKKVDGVSNFGRRGRDSYIHLQTRDGKILKFWYSPTADKNITPALYNKKLTIYSNAPSHKMSADKVIDEKGNVLVDYDYKERLNTHNIFKGIFIPALILINLIIVWKLNKN